MTKKIIGILGGMGPEASKDAYQRIIKYAQSKYNAIQDNQFPNILLYSLGLNDFDETGITNHASVQTQVVEGLDLLHSAGCQAIIITCNTVHVTLENIDPKYKLIHLIQAVSKQAKNKQYKKVGLLCSQTTKDTQLYQQHLNKLNIETLSVSNKDQAVINQIIENIISGKKLQSDIEFLEEKTKQFKSQGAQAVILGCTELPLIFDSKHSSLPSLDSLQIGIEAITDDYYKSKTKSKSKTKTTTTHSTHSNL